MTQDQIDTNSYLGHSTTKTLDRLQLEPLPASGQTSETPSLQETKIARIRLPEETPIPKVTLADLTIPKEKASVEAVSDMLRKYGVCIVKQMFTQQEVAEVNEELDPLFEQKKKDPRLFPKETIRVTATVNKSPAVVRNVLANPLQVGVSSKFLAQKNAFWIGKNINIGYSPSIVSSSISFQIGPHAAPQALHRDDHSDHNIRVEQTAENYRWDSETQVGINIALTRVTKENGGTRVIPGSHLWDHLREPHEEDTIQLEMDRGDGCFMLASTVHAASANTTKDESRRILIIFMTKGTNRQKENIYLGTDVDYFKQFNANELTLLGLSMSEPFGAMLELQDPLTVLKPGYKRKSNYTDVCRVVPI